MNRTRMALGLALLLYLQPFGEYAVRGAVRRASRPRAKTTNMTPTCYDDGKACPGNCDAHVVFNERHNATLNAYDPASSRTAPKKCVKGQRCKICFSGDESSCIVATYRGAGPAPGRFDFTPAFYAENCGKTGLPPALAQVCVQANAGVELLKKRVNCFETPNQEKCKQKMEESEARKAADDVLYDECLRLGEAAFNEKYKDQPKMQRSEGCAYEAHGTGRNSRGQTWKRLLDGACRPGTFAGRDGLDCCSNNLYGVTLLGPECKAFFPQK